MERRWRLRLLAEPVIEPLVIVHDCSNNGAELQRAILKGFGALEMSSPVHAEFDLEKVFTFAEHGEFFRGALTMAGLRYAGDFYELLKKYGKIKVTISKRTAEETK